MFDNLAVGLEKAWDAVRKDGKLTADNIKTPMREIRRALLEADVRLLGERRGERREGVGFSFHARVSPTPLLSSHSLSSPCTQVSLPVVRQFVARVEEKALGVKVIKGIKPDQQLVKVQKEEDGEREGGWMERGNTLSRSRSLPPSPSPSSSSSSSLPALHRSSTTS